MKRPQLTLRDLFWLVLVAALGLAWWREHVYFTRDAGLYGSDATFQMIADHGDRQTQDAVEDLVIEHYPDASVRRRFAKDKLKFAKVKFVPDSEGSKAYADETDRRRELIRRAAEDIERTSPQ